MDLFAEVRDRLIRYAEIGTQSQPNTGRRPSTACQHMLAELLFGELLQLGCREVFYDRDNCVVYGKIPPNLPAGAEDRPFGLVTHMDTAPDVCGDGVKPWVLENYEGGDILLNAEKGIVMRRQDYPNLARYVGQTLVLTDGTTLLGGDDKAAIAAVMTFAEYCQKTPDFLHGTVCLAFTPDEEVGGLAQDLDLERFGAPVAYTIDGDHLGCYQDQTFNAAQATVEIVGVSVHPATAKGIMVNAADLAVGFLNRIPKDERPQTTEGMEGYYYVSHLSADCEHARIRIILRDFERSGLEARETLLRDAAAELNAACGEERICVTIEEEYRNLGEVLRQKPEITARLRTAIERSGLTPVCEPFRGGTDGATLTFRGLPCPNLSAGYENAHGRFEFVPVESMEKNVEILRQLCLAYCEE